LGVTSFSCTGSTAPMSCIRTRRLSTRLLVGRSHWLLLCARSLRLAARLHHRLTYCPVTLALLQPRHEPRLLASRQRRLPPQCCLAATSAPPRLRHMSSRHRLPATPRRLLIRERLSRSQ
jgi:hypothetical protein